MPRWHAASLAAALWFAPGCGAPRPPAPMFEPSSPVAGPASEAASARSVAQLFLELEARGDTASDTLLAAGADFVMTGVRVMARPRLAGVNGPGQASVEEAGISSSGTLAWVVFAYRIAARTPALSERARGTFVLERQRAGWRIRHVHTSMVERWER